MLLTASSRPNRGVRFIHADGKESFQTYPMLLARARRILTGMRQAGIKPRQGVILQIEEMDFHFASFWACVLGGMIPVTVAIPSSYKQKDGVVAKLYHTWKLLGGAPILTNAHLVDSIASLEPTLEMHGLKILSVEELAGHEEASELYDAQPNDPFFYQLTSGSTGVPKCIQETHRGVIAHIHASQQFCRYSENEVTLNWLPFDHVVPILTVHLKDVYLGYEQIHVKPDVILSNPGTWLELIEKHRVTLTWAPNFGFKRVADFLGKNPDKTFDLSSVKFFMNAGEQVTGPVVQEFLRAVQTFGVNETAMQPAFGMAEACTCMTYTNDFSMACSPRRFSKHSLGATLEEVRDGKEPAAEFVDLGAPVPGVAIRITNAKNEVMPERVIGRFQIKGAVVTPGYLHNPRANEEAFVGDGWFNTGDLGFILDGHLFLTGREKEMIIIRGAKFYCYEIEDLVNSIREVEPTFAAACSSADAKTGTEMLSIFFVAKPGSNPLQISRAIRERVTTAFGISPGVVLPLARNQFLKTTSGKIQRTQMKQNLEQGGYTEILQSLQNSHRSDGQAPETDTEKKVAEIWSEVLGDIQFGANTSIFEVGGDSLKASQIISRVREQFSVSLPLPTIFEEARTISGMARWIEKLQRSTVLDDAPQLKSISRGKELPASFGQEQLWILDQMEPGTSLYNICRTVELFGKLDLDVLEQSLNDIVARHDIFRTNLRFDRDLQQVVAPHAKVDLPILDLTGSPQEYRRTLALGTAEIEARIPFQLATGRLFRAKLLRLNPKEHLLVLTFHQTVIDGWSVDIVLRELQEIYSAHASGKPSQLPALKLQYADFAAWQREALSPKTVEEQVAFWKKQLSGSMPSLKLAGSQPKKFATSKARVETLLLSPELTAQLREFNRRENSTLFMTLLAAYNLLLAQCSKQNEFFVGAPKNNRSTPDLEKMAGFFVNTLVLRNKLAPETSFAELVSQIRANSMKAFSNADVPFQKVVQAMRTTGNPSFFQVWFGAIDCLQPFQMGEVKAVPHFVSPGTAQFDLAVFISEQKDTVTCLFEYRTDLFSSDAIGALMTQFEKLVRQSVSHQDKSLLKSS
ncbi:MAG: AMP-binding protein [Verrucomicrobia bacterium]|nr:AMP-binding protein [Verrucomicrobiota bacterium]